MPTYGKRLHASHYHKLSKIRAAVEGKAPTKGKIGDIDKEYKRIMKSLN